MSNEIRWDATIAICTYRRHTLLRDALESLVGQRNPWGATSVLVIDNAAEKEAEDVVEATRPALEACGINPVYVAEPRPGVAAARNRALAEVRTPILCFLDDDEQATPGWLEAMIAPFVHHAADIVCGPVEADFSRSARPDWLTDDLLPLLSCGFRWSDQVHILSKAHESIPEGNCALRMAALEGLRFDERLGRIGDSLMSNEGLTFIVMQSRGAKVVYTPGAKVRHQMHADRLSKRWLLRRQLFQGLSDAQMRRMLGFSCEVMDLRLNLAQWANTKVETIGENEFKTMLMASRQAGLALGSTIF